MDRGSYAAEGVLEDREPFLYELRTRLAAVPAGLEHWIQPSDDRVLDAAVPVDLIDDAINTALRSIERLVIDQNARLDGADLERLTLGVESIRRSAEAAAVAVAERVVVTNPFRGDGFFNGKNYLAHRLKLPSREAHHRVQMARMHHRLAEWREAFITGEVGIAQTSLMARIAANPWIPAHKLLDREAELLAAAKTMPYDEFKNKALRWEALVDTDGAANKAERASRNRHALMFERDEGGWTLAAQFDGLGGAEFHNILNHYCIAEFEADWTEAEERLGKGNVAPADLRRTDLQRRGDALLNMARAAAACPPDAVRPVPVLQVLYDQQTFETLMNAEQVPESRFQDIVCRTSNGHELDLDEAANVVLWGEIQRVVLDAKRHVIDFGRRRRCFTGAAREAALLLATKCDWPGCPVPRGRCEIDHARSWASDGGATNQDNGHPFCRSHNWLKEHGYRTQQDDNGEWHTFHPDGHEIT